MPIPIPAFTQAGFEHKPGDVVVMAIPNEEPVIRRIVYCTVRYAGPGHVEAMRLYALLPIKRGNLDEVINAPECYVHDLSLFQRLTEQYIAGCKI